MKRILINALQAEELRVAVVTGQWLEDLDIEVPTRVQKKANIYKGYITRIEPSLEAAFIEYGGERQGFLSFKEVARSYYRNPPAQGRANIRDVLYEGQELIIQVDKDERDSKGAALTTYVSMAGRYTILMPNNPRSGGVSRRVEGEERAELREIFQNLTIPEGMGAILRTAGRGRSLEELQADIDEGIRIWNTIQTAANDYPAPVLLFQEGSLLVRTMRDYLRDDVVEIIIDDETLFEQARAYLMQYAPLHLPHLKLYKEETPLFTRFQIEGQIENAYQRKVHLPSGGSIVIDRTEALTAIDVNSSRSTAGGNVEETAYQTNLEAAEEIARQLRLRDLGGLVVIDFIDMGPNKNQRDVEQRLKESIAVDRARVQIGRISKFGLLEMSRQRLHPALEDFNHHTCPRCDGQGTIRSVESLGLSVLRLIEEAAMKDRTGRLIAHLPVKVATFLLNEKRPELAALEKRQDVQITLLPDAKLETPTYALRRIREDQLIGDSAEISYKINGIIEEEVYFPHLVKQQAIQAVQPLVQLQTVTNQTSDPSLGWFGRIWLKMGTLFQRKAPAVPTAQVQAVVVPPNPNQAPPVRQNTPHQRTSHPTKNRPSYQERGGANGQYGNRTSNPTKTHRQNTPNNPNNPNNSNPQNNQNNPNNTQNRRATPTLTPNQAQNAVSPRPPRHQNEGAPQPNNDAVVARQGNQPNARKPAPVPQNNAPVKVMPSVIPPAPESFADETTIPAAKPQNISKSVPAPTPAAVPPRPAAPPEEPKVYSHPYQRLRNNVRRDASRWKPQTPPVAATTNPAPARTLANPPPPVPQQAQPNWARPKPEQAQQ